METLVEDIRKKNKLEENYEISIVHKYLNKKSNLWTLIAEVNASAYLKLMYTKKVFVGYSSCRLYDDFNVNICFNCCTYGHSSSKCRNKLCCGLCSGEHEAKVCPQKENLQCVNCTLTNNKYRMNRPTNHAAGDKNKCETYTHLINSSIKKCDYPYNPLHRS